MYASIDGVMDRLKRKLRKYKERRLDGYHGGKHMAEDFLDALESVDIEDEAMAEISPDPSKEITEVKTEEYVDPEAPVITVIKRYVQKGYSTAWDVASDISFFNFSVLILQNQYP